MNADGWYLYGVVEAPPGPLDVERDVELVTEGPLAGVTSRVSLDEFGDTALSERLGDAVWLEENIRRHEQVLERVLASTTVLPCRFCTVYRTEADVRRFLSERQDQLTAALAEVSGRVELGVKAFVDPERFAAGGAQENEQIRELTAQTAQAEGGRAYLVSDRPGFERELAALAAELSSRGLELELTGPWPPYNFVSEELRA